MQGGGERLLTGSYPKSFARGGEFVGVWKNGSLFVLLWSAELTFNDERSKKCSVSAIKQRAMTSFGKFCFATDRHSDPMHRTGRLLLVKWGTCKMR